jgi:hypothetical protein
METKIMIWTMTHDSVRHLDELTVDFVTEGLLCERWLEDGISEISAASDFL